MLLGNTEFKENVIEVQTKGESEGILTDGGVAAIIHRIYESRMATNPEKEEGYGLTRGRPSAC